jgi:hypothetical protein
MTRAVSIACAIALTYTLCACSPHRDQPLAPDAAPTTTQPLATQRLPAVYGEDNRVEVFEALTTAPDLAAAAMSAGVALIGHSNVALNPDGSGARVTGPLLGPLYNLCEGERFVEQVSAARCSGTLIDDDLVLTAGHCVSDARECGARRFVFRFFYEAPGALATLRADDLYHCRRVVARKEVLAEDWAVVQLDRPVVGHQPAQVQRTPRPLADSAPIALVGFGSGLPMKLDLNGRVIAPRAEVLDYFRAAIDAFGGHSGGGVFDAQQRVVGVLSAGAQDYVLSGRCQVVARYPETGEGGGEVVTYAHRAVEGLCATGWPSERLCGRAPQCGDGLCTGAETAASCPPDCALYEAAPWAWTCNASFYAASDDCDCGCGAPDPDCLDLSLRIYGCASGQVCDAQGQCSDARRPAPPAWACASQAFDSATPDAACDCGCGAYDPDCNDPSRPVVGCAQGQVCGLDGACALPSGTHPDTWTCNASFYAASDDCDCGCGAPDPDCDDLALRVFGCDEGEVCSPQGLCARPEGVPEAWTCDPRYYAAGDDCDCGCGAYDPDCDVPALRVLGCGRGLICDPAGSCAAPPDDPAPPNCQCAAPRRAPRYPSPWALIWSLCAAFAAARPLLTQPDRLCERRSGGMN